MMISILKRSAVAVMLAASLGFPPAATARMGRGGVAPSWVSARVQLTGSNEVPTVKTPASGAGSFKVYADGTIAGSITTRRMHGTMAHIHQGAPGHNGPVIIPLDRGPHGTWVVPKGSRLTPEQLKSFRARDLYVNVHSAAHPGGEIRGQIIPEGSCIHAGITRAGAFVVPVARVTVVRLKNGRFGTVDCSTVSYKQEQGVFGVN